MSAKLAVSTIGYFGVIAAMRLCFAKALSQVETQSVVLAVPLKEAQRQVPSTAVLAHDFIGNGRESSKDAPIHKAHRGKDMGQME